MATTDDGEVHAARRGSGRWRRRWPVPLVAGALAGVAGIGAARAEETRPGGGWEITLSPYLWAAGVHGHVTAGGVKSDLDESFGDILEQFRFGGMLLADAHKDRFGVVVNGFFLRTEDDSHPGRLDVDATSDAASVGAAAYYRAAEWSLGGTEAGGPVTLAVEPLAGARLNYSRTELKTKLQFPALGRSIDRQVDASEAWVDPIVGSIVRLRLSDRWSATVEGDVGGFGVGSDFTWNAQGVVGYRLPLGRLDTILTAGYRAFHYDYHDGGFEADLLQQGPLLGVAFRF